MPPLDSPSPSPSPLADALLDDRAVVPCWPHQIPVAQRALADRLGRAVEELGHCVTSAMEIGSVVTARRIESVRLRAAELPGLVREDCR
jgi:hypothetical protein